MISRYLALQTEQSSSKICVYHIEPTPWLRGTVQGQDVERELPLSDSQGAGGASYIGHDEGSARASMAGYQAHDSLNIEKSVAVGAKSSPRAAPLFEGAA